MEKKIKKVLACIAILGAGMHVYNRYIQYASRKKYLTLEGEEKYYLWRDETVFYQKKGNGSPVLLIHDFSPVSSSQEWKKIIDKLSKTHTVYALDLIGCGKSSKPEQTYINYYFVELINSFIENEIKEKTTIVSTGASFTFVTMAARMKPELIDKIITINPSTIQQNNKVPTKLDKYKKRLIEIPIIGTFIYNLTTNSKSILYKFENKYFRNISKIPSNLPDYYYECAHLENNNGKYLYGSIISGYTNVNINHTLHLSDQPIIMIISTSKENAKQYLKINKKIKFYEIENCGYLPQLECPEKIIKILQNEL